MGLILGILKGIFGFSLIMAIAFFAYYGMATFWNIIDRITKPLTPLFDYYTKLKIVDRRKGGAQHACMYNKNRNYTTSYLHFFRQQFVDITPTNTTITKLNHIEQPPTFSTTTQSTNIKLYCRDKPFHRKLDVSPRRPIVD